MRTDQESALSHKSLEALNRLPDEVLDSLNGSLARVLDEIEDNDKEAAMKPLSDLIPSDPQ